ncbi:transposon, En/Spm-like protein [Tanacetum coccineum]
MTEKIYDDVMQVLEDALPPDSKLVGSFYETKKFASDLSLLCEKINSCINGCMLYWGEEDKDLWHDEHVQKDGFMSHPSDAEAWKHFDQTYPPFAEETRNVRLGLCTDGFQPFGQSGKQYSCWPVIERNFTMRAALLWTINDFPAYGMLSGWSTAGKKACPYCMENLKAFSLSNGGKVSWFDCHRQFLPEDHPFRQNKNDFIKNRAELSQSPLTLTGEQVIEQIDEFELKEVTEIEGAEFNASISKSCGWRKRTSFESHDCHVFMQRLIPIAFRELLPITVWKALTELSLFFKDLTCTTIEMDDMIRLQTEIPVILCKLEKIFPPGFFDSMEHLPVHLPYEARVGGPVQYRWMYPFERFLGKLKKKVTNKAKVESSIANAYLIEETSMFCSHYFEPHVKTKMNRVPRNDDGGDEELYEGTISVFMSSGRLSGQAKKRRLGDQEYDAARTYVLLNCVEIEQYVKIFVEEIKTIEPNLTDAQVDTRLEREFANWFNDYAHNSGNIDSQIIKDVASGPLRSVVTYPIYFVNGYKFHTSEHGSGRSTYNSGVFLKGSNYSNKSNDYYGNLVEIVQLEYPALPIKRVALFRYDWFDPTPMLEIDGS